MLSLLATALQASILWKLASSRPWSPKSQWGESAIYFMTNEPSGNSVVSISLWSGDGTLANPVETPTGGVGQTGIFPNNTDGTNFAGPDSLFSQDALVVSGEYLFVVNPGSDTLSMFKIDPNNPQYPVLVGVPASTLGDFPMSVAYSEILQTACVLNGGTKAGVTCFSVDPFKGLTVLDAAPRDISVAISQTTPPTGPPGTASDIVFNPSSTALFVSVKGGMAPGYIFAWPVVDGKVADQSVANVLPKIVVDFSMTFLGCDTRLLVTDAVGAADIVDITYPSLEISLEIFIQLEADEGAACWSAYSPELNNVYVMSASIPNITVIDAASGTIKGIIELDAADMSAEDTAILGKYMYILSGSPNIAIVDLVEGVQVGNFDISSLGPRKPFQGLSIYAGGPGWGW